MTESDYRLDEEALRKKIREELEKEHKNKEQQRENAPQSTEIPGDKESQVLEHYLKEQVEENVYSSFPEFIKCANHLFEIRWLTPSELENDYEFHPYEESRFHKLKNKFSRRRFELPDSPAIREMLENYRAELEHDARKRSEAYKKYLAELKKNNHLTERSQLEARLYEEELDRFYGSKKGYRKYKNHAGEINWMTREEFENQDEFIEEVLTKKQRVIRKTGWTALAITVIGMVWFLSNIFTVSHEVAYLVVEMEETEGDLYIDQSPAFGFTPNEPYPVTPGKHEIMVLRAGFVSSPDAQMLSFASRDTVRMAVTFTREVSSETGIVRIASSLNEAGIFINGSFRGSLGNNPLLSLTAGEYAISLEKEGYLPDPRQRRISLAAGDTVDLSFRMIPLHEERSSRGNLDITSLGMIEVTSNIKDAEIFLNGENTGYKTDYILQKISRGQHIVSVRKEGYVVYPEEKTARLTKDEKTARVHFNLSSTTRPVTIKTIPERGEIFVDGKSVGKGTFSGALPLGVHQVSFGDIPSHIKPESQEIIISESNDNQFEFYYNTILNIKFQPDLNAGEGYSGSMTTGHILEGIQFKTSKQTGPAVRMNETVNEKIWILDYAYQYRNPPGMDAIAIRFRLPDFVEINNPVILKLWIYKTRNDYPLTIKGKPAYRIIVNNGIFKSDIIPTHGIDDISHSHYDQFVINEFMRKGNNTIIISTSPEASTAVALWKILIE